MKFLIEFDTGNAAFDENPTLEVKELLEQAAIHAAGMLTGQNNLKRSLVDSNGNAVGTVEAFVDSPEWCTVVHIDSVRVCPSCGAAMRRPTDPDALATFAFQCPRCRKVV